MPIHRKHLMIITLLAAMILTILPLPLWAQWARPQWVCLVLLGWALYAPEVLGVGTAWIAGLFTDLLVGSLLGLHAFLYALLVYVVIKFNRQIHHFTLIQQAAVMGVLILISLILQYIVMGAVDVRPSSSLFWLSLVTSLLLWPWIQFFMREYV